MKIGIAIRAIESDADYTPSIKFALCKRTCVYLFHFSKGYNSNQEKNRFRPLQLGVEFSCQRSAQEGKGSRIIRYLPWARKMSINLKNQ